MFFIGCLNSRLMSDVWTNKINVNCSMWMCARDRIYWRQKERLKISFANEFSPQNIHLHVSCNNFAQPDTTYIEAYRKQIDDIHSF